jgi:hypothetical protein
MYDSTYRFAISIAEAVMSVEFTSEARFFKRSTRWTSSGFGVGWLKTGGGGTGGASGIVGSPFEVDCGGDGGCETALDGGGEVSIPRLAVSLVFGCTAGAAAFPNWLLPRAGLDDCCESRFARSAVALAPVMKFKMPKRPVKPTIAPATTKYRAARG